jgi:hypothetical protein
MSHSSVQVVADMLGELDQITTQLRLVGDNSILIRDAAVDALENICPANPNIAATVGIDIIGIADEAKNALTDLDDFIKKGLEALNEGVEVTRSMTVSFSSTIESIDLWGWQMKLLISGLFTLPSLLAVGVVVVMLDLDVKPFQKSLTYFFMPLFMLTIIACYVICCLVLPLSAASADACSGGGNVHGGPDDTTLTIYRNLRGDVTDIEFQLVGYYTQQCNPEYDPFGFLSTHLNDLDTAMDSINTAIITVEGNQDSLIAQCGGDFTDFSKLMIDMSNQLKLLKEQVDRSLDLVKCENINKLYVDIFHKAGCSYSVDAMAWIFTSSLVISVCGLIMIMLRPSYYPAEQMGPSSATTGGSGVRRLSTSKDFS